MPNGDDKNLQRLLTACTVYRQKYHAWPSQVRLGPALLWHLSRELDAENFARLAAHLELRTCDSDEISVGGLGVIRYEDIDHSRIDASTRALADRWLGVEAQHRHE
jgi:hypothetical protein